MTTQSDPAAETQSGIPQAPDDSPKKRPPFVLAFALILLATIVAAIAYVFRPDDVPPISEAMQTEP